MDTGEYEYNEGINMEYQQRLESPHAAKINK